MNRTSTRSSPSLSRLSSKDLMMPSRLKSKTAANDGGFTHGPGGGESTGSRTRPTLVDSVNSLLSSSGSTPA